MVTTTADDIARDQAAQAKFTAERQALHMSPEEPFALLGESSPGKEISPGIYQKEVTVLQQQAAWRSMLLLLPSECVAKCMMKHAQLCMHHIAQKPLGSCKVLPLCNCDFALHPPVHSCSGICCLFLLFFSKEFFCVHLVQLLPQVCAIWKAISLK